MTAVFGSPGSECLPHYISSLLMILVLVSLAGEWLQCLGVLSLLMTAVLRSPDSEWLLCLATFEAC
jgi:hypothetical protein